MFGKIVGSAVVAVVLVVAVNIVGDTIYSAGQSADVRPAAAPQSAAAPAQQAAAPAASAPAAPAVDEFAAWAHVDLGGDPAAGKALVRACTACHTFDEGGANRVGPNLYGVFGADVGAHAGFNYSDALLAIEGEWTVEKLDGYLKKPAEFAPGNRMTYAGMASETDRMNLIAYLQTLRTPPEAPAEAAPEEAAEDAAEAVEEAVEGAAEAAEEAPPAAQ